MKTDLRDTLGISVPIIQAPMGGATCPALAAAVSNAGGLGMLALSWADHEDIRRQIRETKALTDRPFGINLVLEWEQQDRLTVCLEEGVPIVSFFWGDPAPLIERVKASGALVMQTVASSQEARRAVENRADVIVAQGWEAGGHVLGKVSTLALIPRVVDAVTPVPVVAAGGIADGRGVAAALMLGASGAWIGTRFLAAQEAAIHPTYRDRLFAAAETDTVYSQVFDGGWPDAPHRTLRNTTIATWDAAGRPEPGARPGEGEVLAWSPTRGEYVRYASMTPSPDAEGNIEALSLWAGQGVGLVRQAQPAAEIIDGLMQEARSALQS
jgi:NAD(P)H-dependent flavin oxidoreductase YrpB (nitropropane dioxygenase family)